MLWEKNIKQRKGIGSTEEGCNKNNVGGKKSLDETVREGEGRTIRVFGGETSRQWYVPGIAKKLVWLDQTVRGRVGEGEDNKASE